MPSFAELKKLVKRVTGQPGLGLNLDQAKAFKAKYPEEYTQYLALRREYTKAWHAELEAICGSSLKPYPAVVKALEAKGYKDILPTGFTGLIDGKGNFYTSSGELIDGKPAVVTFPSVKMNPNPNDSDNNWIFKAVRTDGTDGPYFYTKEFKQTTHQTKFQNVASLNLPAIRKRWLAKLKKFSVTDPVTVASVILEILYQFTARIGTPGNTTFGVSTLQVRHCKWTDNGAILRYQGKDGIAAVHKLVNSNPEHRLILAALELLTEGKEPKTNIFTVKKGSRDLKITPGYVNRLWRALGGGNTTVHKIRTYTATHMFHTLMSQVLNGPKRPKTKKQAVDTFKAMALKVGQALNHVRRTSNGEKITGATALKSYIDGSLQCLYWHELGIPLPKYLQDYDKSL